MKKILIVDGLTSVIYTEKNILRRSDFKIFTATSGKERRWRCIRLKKWTLSSLISDVLIPPENELALFVEKVI